VGTGFPKSGPRPGAGKEGGGGDGPNVVLAGLRADKSGRGDSGRGTA